MPDESRLGAGRISIRPGDLVAIRTRQQNAHIVGRVADAHQGIYLVHRHRRGTTSFDGAVTDVAAHVIDDVVHADESQALSDAMERLWGIAAPWFTTEAAPSPAPLTQRIGPIT